MKQLFDITRRISPGIPLVPGVSPTTYIQEDRGQYLISDITICSHTGTHIDAPAHYLKTGMTIDEVPLESLVGPAQVIDLTRSPDGRITADVLLREIGEEGRVLIKTRFSSSQAYTPLFPCLAPDAADLLVSGGYSCVGIDSPSIEPIICDGYVHRTLLSAGCIIIEMLDLSSVPPGAYELVALPLPIAGCDGSPARVILIKD